MIKTSTMTDWAYLNLLQRDKYRSADTPTFQNIHLNGLWANSVKTKPIIHPDVDPYVIILLPKVSCLPIRANSVENCLTCTCVPTLLKKCKR